MCAVLEHFVVGGEAAAVAMPVLLAVGWGARIRTWECRYQKPMPYRLATPQKPTLIVEQSGLIGSAAEKHNPALPSMSLLFQGVAAAYSPHTASSLPAGSVK